MKKPPDGSSLIGEFASLENLVSTFLETIILFPFTLAF